MTIRMLKAFRFIEISKYDDGGQLMPRSSTTHPTSIVLNETHRYGPHPSGEGRPSGYQKSHFDV